MEEIVNFAIDGHCYSVTPKVLKKFRESTLYKLYKNCNGDTIQLPNLDSRVFAYILKFMRGYNIMLDPLFVGNEYLVKSVAHDAALLNIEGLEEQLGDLITLNKKTSANERKDQIMMFIHVAQLMGNTFFSSNSYFKSVLEMSEYALSILSSDDPEIEELLNKKSGWKSNSNMDSVPLILSKIIGGFFLMRQQKKDMDDKTYPSLRDPSELEKVLNTEHYVCDTTNKRDNSTKSESKAENRLIDVDFDDTLSDSDSDEKHSMLNLHEMLQTQNNFLDVTERDNIFEAKLMNAAAFNGLNIDENLINKLKMFGPDLFTMDPNLFFKNVQHDDYNNFEDESESSDDDNINAVLTQMGNEDEDEDDDEDNDNDQKNDNNDDEEDEENINNEEDNSSQNDILASPNSSNTKTDSDKILTIGSDNFKDMTTASRGSFEAKQSMNNLVFNKNFETEQPLKNVFRIPTRDNNQTNKQESVTLSKSTPSTTSSITTTTGTTKFTPSTIIKSAAKSTTAGTTASNISTTTQTTKSNVSTTPSTTTQTTESNVSTTPSTSTIKSNVSTTPSTSTQTTKSNQSVTTIKSNQSSTTTKSNSTSSIQSTKPIQSVKSAVQSIQATQAAQTMLPVTIKKTDISKPTERESLSKLVSDRESIKAVQQAHAASIKADKSDKDDKDKKPDSVKTVQPQKKQTLGDQIAMITKNSRK